MNPSSDVESIAFETEIQDLAELNVLDAEQCERALKTIDSIRANWTQRHPALPFFTLGAASYIDAASSREIYAESSRRLNPILLENFGWLLERLKTVLQAHLGGPVEWHPNAALPGFHIYLAHKMFEQPIASVHCDSQYDLLDWSGLDGEAERANARSFTLALALPQKGGGLNTWPLHRSELVGLNIDAISKRVRAAACTYHPYAIGRMVVHTGDVMHQAAPASDIVVSDRRITLQGHCLRVGGIWYVYW